jgi:hypothetical protein
VAAATRITSHDIDSAVASLVAAAPPALLLHSLLQALPSSSTSSSSSCTSASRIENVGRAHHLARVLESLVAEHSPFIGRLLDAAITDGHVQSGRWHEEVRLVLAAPDRIANVAPTAVHAHLSYVAHYLERQQISYKYSALTP